MSKKMMYCTLDNETLGGAANPKGIYHLAGRIHDRKGHIYATFNYLVCEFFEEIEGAFYGKKKSLYSQSHKSIKNLFQ